MFGDELVIGSLRAEAIHLKRIMDQVEDDALWREHSMSYAREIRIVEKNLRRIRKAEFEPVGMCN